jgi:hypothetical protein
MYVQHWSFFGYFELPFFSNLRLSMGPSRGS